MMQVKSALLVVGLSLLTLTGCATDTAQKAADTAQNAAEDAKQTVTDTATDATKAVEKGVDTAKEAATQTTDAATKAVEQGKDAVTDMMSLKDGFSGMTTGVTQTMEAVKAGDFAKASTEFDKVKTTWTSVEGAIKTKSAENYPKIEEAIKNVDSLLKAEKPDQAQIMSALEGLTKSLTSITL